MKVLARHVPVVAAYVFVTMVYAWPVAANLSNVAPHDAGDPLLSTWALWWNARAVPFTDAWWNGPMFVPAEGVMAFSDHRVGLSLITTPLILAGVTPLAAHNVVFLLSFLLSAVAAYALAYTLTGRRDVAFIGGLAFGFTPFRADHLPHLELLASFWLPVVLLTLHRAVDTGRIGWHVALAVSLTLTGFTTGYYFFFAGVLIGAWLLWFLPLDLPVRRYAWLAGALAAPFVPLAPVLLRYREIHTAFGLSRTLEEVERFSADLRGFFTPPRTLWFWNVSESWQTPEGAAFPGVTCVVVVGLALWRTRARHSAAAPLSRPRLALLVLAMVFAVLALIPGMFGPMAIDLGWLRISLSQAYKPLSIATLCLLGLGFTSPVLHAEWRRRSPLVFYALATLLMWAFALGPTARLLGERVLYKAPYAWLMLLPGFGTGFRAPGRFAMLGALTLSVAAALAVVRLGARFTPNERALLLVLVSSGVLLDGWVWPFPVAPAPVALAVPAQVPRDAVVLEWPVDVFEDAAAMYRATQHERPIVNGLSGYAPPHYGILKGALDEGRMEVLDALPTETSLAVFVSRERSDDRVMARLMSLPDVSRVETTETHHVAIRGPRPLAAFEAPDEDRMLPLAALSVEPPESHDEDAPQAAYALDEEPRTAWYVETQSGDERLEAELESESLVAAVMLGQGPYTAAFPRELIVSVSADGVDWTDVWEGGGGAPALAAAVSDPREIRVVLTFPAVTARFVRVRQVGRSDEPWAVAEFRVLGPAARP